MQEPFSGASVPTFRFHALIAVRICTPMVFAPYFSLFSILNTTFFFASIRTLPIGVPFSTQSALYSDRFNDTILVGTAKGRLVQTTTINWVSPGVPNLSDST